MPVFTTPTNFTREYGVKALVFGPPGSEKTRTIPTCPRPVLLAVETNLIAIEGSTIPMCLGNTPALIEDFFRWLGSSAEAKNFDTICIDSITEISTLIVAEQLNGKSNSGAKVNGEAAYGNMLSLVMGYINQLKYTRQKHVYVTAQQTTIREGGVEKRIPYFKGRALRTEAPHAFELILHADLAAVPGAGHVKAFRTKGSSDIMARDNSGKLAEFEQLNMTNIYNKIIGA